jgi:hypothetical protein
MTGKWITDPTKSNLGASKRRTPTGAMPRVEREREGAVSHTQRQRPQPQSVPDLADWTHEASGQSDPDFGETSD